MTNDFYVGYLPKAPTALAGFVRRIVVVLGLAVVIIALMLVVAQNPFANSNFEYGKVRSFEGVVEARPFPTLLVARLGEIGQNDKYSLYLLVAPGKHEPRDPRGPPTTLRGCRRVAASGPAVCQDDRGLFGCLGLRDLCHLAIHSQCIVGASEIAALACNGPGTVRPVPAGQDRDRRVPTVQAGTEARRVGFMCTLSVITRSDGYLLAMNRDERIARGAGEPPQVHHRGATTAVYPGDGAGGTWIAANEHGITLALLNRSDVVPLPCDRNQPRSRGEIIPALASAPSLTGLQAAFGTLNLHGIRPFRFVGVFPPEQAIAEWGWDSVQLTFQTRGWQSLHWFSSSLSDRQAESLRGAAWCRGPSH